MPGHHGGHGGGYGGVGVALLDPAFACVDGGIGGDGANFGADYNQQAAAVARANAAANNRPVYGVGDPRNPNYNNPNNYYQQQLQQNQQAYGQDGWGGGYGGNPYAQPDPYAGQQQYGGPPSGQPNDQIRQLEMQCRALKKQRDAAPRGPQRRMLESQLKACQSQLQQLKANFGQNGQWGQSTPAWTPPVSTVSTVTPVLPTLVLRTAGLAPPSPKPGPGQPGYIAPPTGYLPGTTPGSSSSPNRPPPPTGYKPGMAPPQPAGEFGIETSQYGEFARSYKPTFGSEFGCQTNRKMG